MQVNDDFILWLVNDKSYSIKSASDLRSRLKRLQAAVGIPDKYDNAFIKDLNTNDIFNSYTTQVKSHTRRALRLFKEFKDERQQVSK